MLLTDYTARKESAPGTTMLHSQFAAHHEQLACEQWQRGELRCRYQQILVLSVRVAAARMKVKARGRGRPVCRYKCEKYAENRADGQFANRQCREYTRARQGGTTGQTEFAGDQRRPVPQAWRREIRRRQCARLTIGTDSGECSRRHACGLTAALRRASRVLNPQREGAKEMRSFLALQLDKMVLWKRTVQGTWQCERRQRRD
jgi:hypothetical protein